MRMVKNDWDLRAAYELLSILSSKDSAARVGGPEKLAGVIVDTKRAIRLYTHREIDYDRRIIRDDGMDGLHRAGNDQLV